MTIKRKTTSFLFLLLLLVVAPQWAMAKGGNGDKREFRGAWIQCVNGQFQGMSTQAMQQTLTHQLDELQKDGVNAIIFQVRPECDALYQSNIEPWSRYLTGKQGKAPSPYWDPLKWMVDQCHRRGMELHAWINPYRAKTKGTVELALNHVAIQRPSSVFSYDGQFILNPAKAENREYIYKVTEDIVSRYDIDGFHIDDYFYPYPVAGIKIPDEQDYRANSNGIADINDWRRYNVNVFIKELGEHIHKIKPWVKFGVSPFGIYRNKRNDPNGSDTHGLQNYDDLFADVLMWVNNGWVDYCVPQLYWEIGNKAADYLTLINGGTKTAQSDISTSARAWTVPCALPTLRTRTATRWGASFSSTSSCQTSRELCCGTPRPWSTTRDAMAPCSATPSGRSRPCSLSCPTSTRPRQRNPRG